MQGTRCEGTAGDTRGDGCRGRGQWLEPSAGLPFIGTVAIKALLSIRHGTSILATGGELFGGTQFPFDFGKWRAMKHQALRLEIWDKLFVIGHLSFCNPDLLQLAEVLEKFLCVLSKFGLH